MSNTILPTHIGLILDGNRRWAKQHGMPVLEGHRRGMEAFRKVALHAFDQGVQYVSAYIFSTENWLRTQEEVTGLMGLVLKAVERHLGEFHKAGIRVVVLGRRSGLDKKVLAAVRRTEEKTRDNTRGTLALCFNYGGHAEVVDAVRHIVAQGLSPSEIDEAVVAAALYVPEVPPIDLLIRTSGEYRTSGFMLYRAAYAELLFAQKYWPDYTPADLTEALSEYATRKRRFGK